MKQEAYLDELLSENPAYTKYTNGKKSQSPNKSKSPHKNKNGNNKSDNNNNNSINNTNDERLENQNENENKNKNDNNDNNINNTAATVETTSHDLQTETALAGYETYQWIQCDGCNKWRRVPAFVNLDEIETWYCKYNQWDPQKADCNVPEESYDATQEHTLTVNTHTMTEENLNNKKEFYNKLLIFLKSDNNKQKKHEFINISDANHFIVKTNNNSKEIDLYHLYTEVCKSGNNPFSLCLSKKLLFEKKYRWF